MSKATSSRSELDRDTEHQHPTGGKSRHIQVQDGQESAAVSDPSPDEIARRAYDHYSERGFENGHDMDDWLQAERELRRN